MNFDFTDEQKQFAEQVRRFAREQKNRIAEHVFDRRFDQRGRSSAAT